MKLTNDPSTPASNDQAPVEGQYQAPKIVYICYLIGLVFPLVALGGVIYACIANVSDPGARSHLSFQVRTFLWGLVLSFVGAILTFALIGWFFLIALWIWILTRCITGLQLAGASKPISKLGSLGFIAK